MERRAAVWMQREGDLAVVLWPEEEWPGCYLHMDAAVIARNTR